MSPSGQNARTWFGNAGNAADAFVTVANRP